MKNDAAILEIISKAGDKLKTARIDFQNGQYDDTVSRAYYAVFHIMTAALFNKGTVYSSHSQTIGAFNKEYIKSGIFPKNFSRMIQDLFEDRQTDDYDVASDIDRHTADADIKNAESICITVEKYLLEKTDRKGD